MPSFTRFAGVAASVVELKLARNPTAVEAVGGGQQHQKADCDQRQRQVSDSP